MENQKSKNYEETMRKANEAIDHFHALLISEDYFGADNYLDEIKPIVIEYYGEATFRTLQEEMDEALMLPF